MRPEELDLKKLRKPLEESLGLYTIINKGLSFQEFPDFSLTPEKPNSARTVIPVTYAGAKVGDMYVIVFLYRDGTGDQKTYRLEDVVIPAELKHEKKPERVIPRAKTGIIAEGFFPLFSINSCGLTVPFAAHLDELTLDEEKRVRPEFQLGQRRTKYWRLILSGFEGQPKVQLTTGTDELGNRFGDPHAIYHLIDAGEIVQVAGFLSITDPANPLMHLAKSWEKPLRYKQH